MLDTQRLDLSDPEDPDARQPYHAGFGTARRLGPALTRLLGSVKRFGGHAVAGLIRRYRAEGYHLAGAGIVAGSLIDPDSIANAHIRIHALEGLLFRTIVASSAARGRLPSTVWRERDLLGHAAERLGISAARLRAAVSSLPHPAPGPWRSEQKAASLAAWLILVRRPS